MKGKGIIELENCHLSILNEVLVSSCKLKSLLKIAEVKMFAIMTKYNFTDYLLIAKEKSNLCNCCQHLNQLIETDITKSGIAQSTFHTSRYDAYEVYIIILLSFQT